MAYGVEDGVTAEVAMPAIDLDDASAANQLA
jgi:hypothetical protein